jgi:hypothetical protein
MSLQKPHFTSQIPPTLLQDISDREKYILESLSIMSQNGNWTVEEMIKQSNKLEELDKKVKIVDEKISYTNGKVAASLTDIQALKDKNLANKESDDEIKKFLAIKKYICRLLSSKFFWFSVTVISLLLVKSGFFTLFFNWLSNHLGV